ncbi:MAG TPA: 23S rRNA pseudouridine(1911/1915/1917) synthase RluD [Steroidobacteraceae bacterium]|nr:23S rRNA pseudouridine(1911/1915/1917) synthase RluD [Steroidobacteraceae bacterium]HQR47941.1 23S rRNA pseudouridine(1911/1915/1917) synthase RluD [Steroidobacteraceae bacterium]
MTASTVRISLEIPVGQAGQRLDQALAALLPDHSRSRLKSWIESGEVLVDGSPRRPRDKVMGGESVAITATLAEETRAAPQDIPLVVVHEDRHVLVVDKPAGLVVHPGAGNPDRTLQNALLARDPKLALLPRAGIVHRLDKDTSGLLVVARTLAAHTALVRMLEERDIHREYEAVCRGVMTAGGTVDAPIARHPTDRVRMAVRQGGRESVTHYRVIRRFRAHTHVRVQLETGRTHQIRVHLAHAGFPIVGDRVYGGRLAFPKGASDALREALRNFPRQALHAARLEFAHPVSGKAVSCVAPLPADMQELLRVLEADAART